MLSAIRAVGTNRALAWGVDRWSLNQRCGASEHDREQAAAGRTFEDGPTRTRRDARKFELARFRFDYILQKANLKRDSKKQIFAIVSMNYKDSISVGSPPPSEYGRKTLVFYAGNGESPYWALQTEVTTRQLCTG